MKAASISNQILTFRLVLSQSEIENFISTDNEIWGRLTLSINTISNSVPPSPQPLMSDGVVLNNNLPQSILLPSLLHWQVSVKRPFLIKREKLNFFLTYSFHSKVI